MTPEEKINYALSLEADKMLGVRSPRIDALIPAALRLALAAISARKQLFLMDDIDSAIEGADSPFVDEMEKIIWGDVLDSFGRRAQYPNVNETLFNALDAFLALLPEPPKEG